MTINFMEYYSGSWNHGLILKLAMLYCPIEKSIQGEQYLITSASSDMTETCKSDQSI